MPRPLERVVALQRHPAHRRLLLRHALQVRAVAHHQVQAVAQAVTLVRQLEPAGPAAQAAIAQLAESTVRTLAQMA